MNTFIQKLSIISLLSMGLSHGSDTTGVDAEMEEETNETAPLVPESIVDFVSSSTIDLPQIQDGVLYVKDEVQIKGDSLIRYGLVHKPGLSFEEETEFSITFYYMKAGAPHHKRKDLIFHMVAAVEEYEGELIACYRHHIGPSTAFSSTSKDFAPNVFPELDRLFRTNPTLPTDLFSEYIAEYK